MDMARSKVGKTVESLGEYLREQRVSSRLSVRQLAEQAGVSNPYLSQIERGLRRPSAEVLQQLAKALRISAEQLYLRAGIISPDEGVGGSVELAVLGDPTLTEQQKQTLLDVYASFITLERRERRVLIHPARAGITTPHPAVRNPEGEITMAKARFDIPTQLPVAVARPVYAGVGVTDRVVEVVRGAVADVQKRALAVQHDVSKTVSGLDYQPQALREQATRAVTTGVDTLGKGAQARRKVVEQRLTALQVDAHNLPVRLQKLVDEQVTGAMETYDELVRRGETLVGRVRRQPTTQEAAASAQTTTAKAKTTRTQATKTAKKTAKKTTSTAKKTARKSPAKSSAKATATSAKKTASKTARATTDAASKVGDSAE